jgi:hypothetical protein
LFPLCIRQIHQKQAKQACCPINAAVKSSCPAFFMWALSRQSWLYVETDFISHKKKKRRAT